ncbi:MAG TPA: zinc ABC transporter substrate-binding protein [Burkholderiaceae bacterium]|nr:zinc ABC transporter substrate-binding protein [Burkholderiaceae bacterium]
MKAFAKRLQTIFVAAALAMLAARAVAALNVFACEPEWAALAVELGGDQVNVYSATTGLQDAHRVEAKPSLLARARNADLAVCTGAELETGWLPVVLREAGNAQIQPGRPGYFEAAQVITLLEKPTRLDRAEGDVHAAGNPHIQTDPRNIARVAEALAQRLAQLAPAQAGYFEARHRAFADRWQAAIRNWEARAAPLAGRAIVVQHRAFPYLQQWLRLREVAALEPKPGIEPSVAYLSQVLAQLKREPAQMVVCAAYQNDRPARWIAERAKVPVVILPFTVGGTPRAKDLYGLFDDTIDRLLEAVR